MANSFLASPQDQEDSQLLHQDPVAHDLFDASFLTTDCTGPAAGAPDFNSEPIVFTESNLAEYTKILLEHFRPGDADRLKTIFTKSKSTSSPLKIGTLCSGSDAVVDVLQAPCPFMTQEVFQNNQKTKGLIEADGGQVTMILTDIDSDYDYDYD